MNVSLRRLIPASIAAVVLTLAAIAAQPQAGGSGLTITLSSESANLQGSDDVAVTVRFTNYSGEAVYLPKRSLPSDVATAGVFTVTRDGQPVPYLGAIVKRGALTPADFVKIAPGASLDFRVELSSLYDLSASGVYAIRYDAKSVETLRGRASAAGAGELRAVTQAAQSLDLSSNAIALTVAGDPVAEARRAAAAAAIERAREATPSFASSVSFVGCSNTRQNQIRTALTSAESYASNSLGYLNAGTRNARYTLWFGTYTSGRYSTVRSHFTNISSALGTKPLVFDCSTCPGSDLADAYAYVYSNQPYRVYLCNAFWAAPNTGTDSRAGTIIHEVSHFTVVAGTGDYAYGQSAARRLATSNPARAVQNADSHEYFAENTPFQN